MRVLLVSSRTLAGVTLLVLPFAIVVHLASEALALGAQPIAPDFWLRHAYLMVPLALALWSFRVTVGLGVPHAETIRRCALVRAQLRRAGSGSTILAFTLANLAFFAVTQLLEGAPIATASIGVGLAVAVIGSLLSALIIYFWGRPIVAGALALAVSRARNHARFAFAQRSIVDVPRAAATAFSLFVPNRPPPSTSPA
jgi:hypothetical protein